jgi:hypothetical protein
MKTSTHSFSLGLLINFLSTSSEWSFIEINNFATDAKAGHEAEKNTYTYMNSMTKTCEALMIKRTQQQLLVGHGCCASGTG